MQLLRNYCASKPWKTRGNPRQPALCIETIASPFVKYCVAFCKLLHLFLWPIYSDPNTPPIKIAADLLLLCLARVSMTWRALEKKNSESLRWSSVLALMEFRGELSELLSDHLCVPKWTHRVFCRTHQVCCRTQWVLSSETVLSKQQSARLPDLLVPLSGFRKRGCRNCVASVFSVFFRFFPFFHLSVPLTKLLLTKNYSEITTFEKLRISYVISGISHSFPEIFKGAQFPKNYENNSQGIIFVIILCQRVFSVFPFFQFPVSISEKKGRHPSADPFFEALILTLLHLFFAWRRAEHVYVFVSFESLSGGQGFFGRPALSQA